MGSASLWGTPHRPFSGAGHPSPPPGAPAPVPTTMSDRKSGEGHGVWDGWSVDRVRVVGVSPGRSARQHLPRPQLWTPGAEAPWAGLPSGARRLTVASIGRSISAGALETSPIDVADVGPAASVLAVLAPAADDELEVIVTRRSRHLRTHAGEAQPPGGRPRPRRGPGRHRIAGGDRGGWASTWRRRRGGLPPPASYRLIRALDRAVRCRGRTSAQRLDRLTQRGGRGASRAARAPVEAGGVLGGTMGDGRYVLAHLVFRPGPRCDLGCHSRHVARPVGAIARRGGSSPTGPCHLGPNVVR